MRTGDLPAPAGRYLPAGAKDAAEKPSEAAEQPVEELLDVDRISIQVGLADQALSQGIQSQHLGLYLADPQGQGIEIGLDDRRAHRVSGESDSGHRPGVVVQPGLLARAGSPGCRCAGRH